MMTAFQSDAFQNNAFQVGIAAAPVGAGGNVRNFYYYFPAPVMDDDDDILLAAFMMYMAYPYD